MSVLLPAPFSPMKACTSPGQMLRLTLLSTRTPGKLLHIWRTSRIGRALPGPALVLVDIVFGDQVYRNQDNRLIGLLAVKNIVPHFNCFLRHHIGGLRRTARY